MTRRAVTNNATGRVLRWGDTDFAAVLGAGETQQTIGAGETPIDGVPLYYQKITGGSFAAMTAGERAAVDTQRAAEDAAQLPDAATIARAVQAIADLPVPPPRAGLLVALRNTGDGSPGLAYSTPTKWVVLRSIAVIP